MERVHRVIKTVEPHDSVERYAGLGVDVVQGEAKITSPWTVEIKRADGAKQTLTTRAIVIAAGAAPFVPPIPGIEEVGYVTSDTVWELRELPQRLVVLGGGPIGSELAQCFARLGSKVTQVEMLPRIMIKEDPEISEMVAQRFRQEGIDVRVDTKAKSFKVVKGEKIMVAEHDGKDVEIPFDVLLCAVGRVARTKGYGLEELGIPVTKQQHRRGERASADDLPEHLRLRRRRRAVPVHPHRRAHGVVLRGERAVRPVQEVQGRLLGDPVGDLHRAGGRARRPERDRGEGERHRLRGHDLRPRRPRPRDRRRRGRGPGQGAHRAGQGPHPRRDDRRRARRRRDRRVRRRDEARLRAEQDPRHDPHLPDAHRSEQVRGRQLEARARAAVGAARVSSAITAGCAGAAAARLAQPAREAARGAAEKHA